MIAEKTLTHEFLIKLEQQEAACFSEHFQRVPHKLAEWLGIRLINNNGYKALMAAGINVLAFNRVIGLGLENPVREKEVDDIIAFYKDAGINRFFVQPGPQAQLPFLPEMLREKGFRHHNNWVKLFRRIDSPMAESGALQIRQIGVEQADIFANVIIRSFEWPDELQQIIALPVGRPGWQHYLAYDEEKPVACAALYINGDYASLAFAATLPEYRKMGAQSALIARRFNDAAQLGCRWMITETAEETPERPVTSYRNMRRLGFEVAYNRPNYLFEVNPG